MFTHGDWKLLVVSFCVDPSFVRTWSANSLWDGLAPPLDRLLRLQAWVVTSDEHGYQETDISFFVHRNASAYEMNLEELGEW
jgi:hypothetical protein